MPTIAVFQLLVPGIIAGFLIFPLGALLASVNRQSTNTKIFFVAALANVSANLVLIPLWAERGAAVAASMTYVWIFIASMVCVWATIQKHVGYLLVMAVKIIAACLAMGAYILFVRDTVPVYTTILSAIGVYAISALILRVMSPQEIRSILNLDKK
jgi:O-antigen/teichoic acid export membrane protein